jgi:oxidoreductase
MERTATINIKALIVGGTGATGRILVDALINNSKYSNVSLIARRKLDRWDNLEEAKKSKLNWINCNDLEIFNDQDKEKIISTLGNDLKFDTLFCCLGGDPTGDFEAFKKVDFDYMLYTASLCEKFGIPHFVVLSSRNANSNSCFNYLKVKGKADEEIIKKNIKRISIFRPPLICDRENARFGEKFLNFVPFYPKMKTGEIIDCMVLSDLQYTLASQQTEDGYKIFEWSEMKELKDKKFNM